MEQTLCPVCHQPMNYNADGKAKNPRAPDYKCSNRNCKFQLNPQTNQYEPSEYITAIWLPKGTPARQVAMPKFESELKESVRDQRIEKMFDEKTENIARSVALNNACEVWARKPEVDVNQILFTAEKFYEYLRKV